MFRDISAWHLGLILLAFVVLFGYKKLPDATRSLGRSMRIFKSEIKGLHDDEPKQVENVQPSRTEPKTEAEAKPGVRTDAGEPEVRADVTSEPAQPVDVGRPREPRAESERS
jgi:sec-independent protein translocase protein TatA